MKKTKLFKTLLVVAALLVGASAWADTFTGSVSFAAMSRITNNNDGTFTTASNAGNGYALALADLSGIENINGATSITLDFNVTIPSGSRWLIGIGDKNTRGTNANGSSKSTYNTEGLIMRFGTSDGSSYRVNGGTNNSNAFGVDVHCSITVDVVNKKYTYSITNGETNLFSASNVATDITSPTVVEAYSWLNSTTLTISDVSYSFEYAAESYTYTVNAVDGDNNILKVLETNTALDPKTVVYPYAINVDGKWYTTNATSFGVTVNSISPEANVVYEEAEDVVAFFEAESVAGENTVYSNGAFGTVAAQNKRDRGISAGELPSGKYKFIARLVADGNSGRAITLRQGTNDPFASVAGNNTTHTAEAEFALFATTNNLFINGANSGTEKTNLSTSFDYIIIRKIGDAFESMSIVGDFSENAWEATGGLVMARDAENSHIWTATISDFIPEAKTYEYKAIANQVWGAYELPGEGNASITFGEEPYPLATYDLIFTANTETHQLTLKADEHATYTVAGTASFFGSDWSVTDTNNDMVKNEEGNYTISYNDVVLTNGTNIEYKVAKNHSWDNAYPSSNMSISITKDGTYDITISINPLTKEVSQTVNMQHSYTVAGDAVLFASDWDVTDTNNDMTKNSDGTYSITYTNVALTGNVSYKVVEDHAWKTSGGNEWPNDNRIIGISMAGNYDITIHFNPATGDLYETMAVYKEITSAGYATYCAPYDLNFDGTGVTAYIAEIDGTAVSFKEVKNAPANTGLLLKGNAGSYKLPMEISNTDVSTNNFIGVLDNTHVDAGAFVLMNGSKGVGFYKTTNVEGFTVGANTAYIPATASARTFIGFNFDETTGIDGVAAEKVSNGEVYNLQGQRVMNAKKGLYIMNGKKVLVK